MALSLNQTVAVCGLMRPGMRVASMGYPDIIAPDGMIEMMVSKMARKLKYRSDSEAICKRHGLKNRLIPDAHSFFELFDCALDVFDVVRERGCEKILDLNAARIDPALRAWNYDIVLDVGTAEHCFNIGQALINMAGLVKQGGYIIHENPFNCGNHGFYNLNPTLFADFYAANGFEVMDCRLVSRDGGECKIPHTKRFRFIEQEVNTFCQARRVEVKSFVFPVQSKYANLIPAAGVDRAKEVANG